MKHLSLALALIVGAACAPAFAGPCVALDYQEMKDMSPDELVKEACKANATASANFDYSLATPSLSSASQEAMRDHEQCSGQVDRIRRLLKSKGVAEKLYELCAKQARDLKIETSTETRQ